MSEPVKRYFWKDIGMVLQESVWRYLAGYDEEKWVHAEDYDRDIKAAKFAPLGDNHHNAAQCPYCNPKYTEQAKTIERLRAELEDTASLFTDLRDQFPLGNIARVKIEYQISMIDAALTEAT